MKFSRIYRLICAPLAREKSQWSHSNKDKEKLEETQEDLVCPPAEVTEPPAKNKEEERQLRSIEGYHGYLPREDTMPLLKKQGDYLLRICETEKDKVEIVLAVLGEQINGDEAKAAIRNFVVTRKDGRYFLTKNIQFSSLLELIDHYKTTKWTGRTTQKEKFSFLLVNAIPLQKWEFTHADVTVGSKLGVGTFGKICSGTLTTKEGLPIAIAVKFIHGNSNISSEKLNEARLVRHFKHKNIVQTYGVALDKRPIYILFELFESGPLDDYLRSHCKTISESDRLAMCMGVARGLEYLHQNNTVLAFVAARICLVSSDKIVKISDFELALVINPEKASRRSKTSLLPVKWLAPETIKTLHFFPKSDVYGFGVLCFEVFNDGGIPYSGISNNLAMTLIAKGECLQLGNNCPEVLKEFLKQKEL